MEKVKFGTTFKVNPYSWREVYHFGEIVQDDKPFAGDLNERYTKFCFDFKKLKPSTLVDYDVLETFYGDLLNRASIDYLEGEYAITKFQWNDADRILTIEDGKEDKQNNSPKREFMVELMPSGEKKPVSYSGDAVEVKFQ